jgi:uncharacterized OB-fold protein
MTETISATESMGSMPVRIQMPYTLTPGQATGIYLAELRNRRLIGSRHGDRVIVPGQDFDGTTGAPFDELVELQPIGSVLAFTKTDVALFGLVQLDGADVAFVHRLVDVDEDQLAVGARVVAVWADEPIGNALDLVGFRPASDDTTGATGEASSLLAPLEQVDYTMTLDYEHAYGPYYGTLFDAVRTDRRLRGVKCSRCRRTLLPPRAVCDICFVPTAEWVDVEAIGTVQACSIVHIAFIGQRVPPPYVYAEIVLDGTSTRLIHMVGGIDADRAKTEVRPGSRVRAFWSDRRTGSLADVEYFELIEGDNG